MVVLLRPLPRVTYPPPAEWPLPPDSPEMAALRIPDAQRLQGGFAVPSENDAQRSIKRHLDSWGFVWQHAANEAHLMGGGKTMNILKSKGLKEGFPDIQIIRPFYLGDVLLPGLAIELKRADGTEKDVSGPQRWWLAHLREMGWMAEWCRGEHEALRLIRFCYGVR